ncbi:MAG TPA: LytTR family transcriptional regulator DNA-binding domain-containing protein [Candidatus Mediterraneibacter cottocaccae]|nr:LytTR family transcriptional regulator DNA-binding domain-containing protein [Candidatus Mediterraneibacter cottocaccae]
MDNNHFSEAGQLIQSGKPVHFEGPLSTAPLLQKCFTPSDGFVEDSGALYDNMSIKQYLSFFAGLSGSKQQLDSAVEQMHLADILKKKISKCSDGEKVRLRIAREISKGAEDFFLVNPIAFADEESKKIILGWMETFYEKNGRLATLSVSHRDTCICPGGHYEILEEGIRCIDQPEVTDENPDLPVISKISVSYNEKTFLFNPEEIDYVEANDGKVYVYVRQEQYLGSYKMSELEEKLTKFGFFRCHRSYIVNMQKVTELVKWTRNSYSLRLIGYGKTDVPLSKGKIQELRGMYEF